MTSTHYSKDMIWEYISNCNTPGNKKDSSNNYVKFNIQSQKLNIYATAYL